VKVYLHSILTSLQGGETVHKANTGTLVGFRCSCR